MFKIEEAAREGAKVVIGLAGTSGSGKTYSALLLAYGLAGKSGKHLGFLDTENRRGRLYSDILPEKFRIADFEPPFSPDRYIEGIRAFEEAGCKVLVIDSMTHEWEGTGGCEEIATEGNPRVARWNIAKLHHKRFMNALLQSSMDIVCCFRAREKVDMKDPKNIKQLGLQAITEKNVLFEMTASLMMHDSGQRQDVIKCPEALTKILGRQKGFIGIEDGVNLREWIDGGEAVDRELERYRSDLKAKAEYGIEALATAWKNLPQTIQHALKDEKESFKASAAGYDEHRARTSEPKPEDALV